MKRIPLFLSLVILLFITSCQSKLKEDYPNLEGKVAIKVISPKDAAKILDNKESFVLIMGFKSCPWCQALLPVANEIAKDKNYKNLYYLDIYEIRENKEAKDRDVYVKLYDFLAASGMQVIDVAKDRINAPTTIAVKDGELVDFNIDTVATHKMNEQGILPALSEEEKTELEAILIRLILNTK